MKSLTIIFLFTICSFLFSQSPYTNVTISTVSSPEEPSIQINPKNVDAYFMRGVLRIEFGDMKNGCLDLSKAGELGDSKAYEVIKEKCNQKDQGNDGSY